MNILLVENYTKHIAKILSLFEEFQVETIQLEELHKINYKNYNGIILSGGSKYSIFYETEKYQKEIELILNFEKPILGICLGFEIIAHAYLEKISPLGFRQKGNLNITLNKERNEKLLEGISENFQAYFSHKWNVIQTENLITLATSKNGVEIIKHKTKPHYGVQFHPEISVNNVNPKKIVENFKLIVKNYLNK